MARKSLAVVKIHEDRELSYIRDCLGAYLKQAPAPPPPCTSIDWNRFYQLLVQQNLTGLFVMIGRSYPDLWPREIKEQLREDRYRQLHYVDWCSRQAEAVLSTIRSAGIPVIALKGWALAQIVYGGDQSQRPASDIDLLIHPQDAARAVDLLGSLNYQPIDLEPWPGHFRRFLNSCHYRSAQTYPGSNLGFNLDLHWGIPDAPYYDRRIPVSPMFDRAEPISVAGVEVKSLNAEDYLVYNSAHMAHHGYPAILSRYYEVAALILRGGAEFDWSTVLKTASAWHVTLPLRQMLNEIEKLWPGIVPLSIHEEARQQEATWGERFTNWCLTPSTRTENIVILLSCLNTPGLFWRLRFFCETAFPSPAYLKHYFGPAPGNFWPLLNLRRYRRFLGI